MKGLKSKPVCCFCKNIIAKKPIPVGSNSYAHDIVR